MNMRDIRLPDRHWLVLAVALLISAASVWILLGAEELLVDEVSIADPTKLKLAPTGSATALLEQPLFNKGRSPVVTADEAGALALMPGGEAAPVPPAPPPQLPTLVGLATGKGKAVAIMKGADGTAQNMSVGDSIDGWTVVSISRTGASVSAAGVTQNIILNYADQQGGSTSPALAATAPSERGN